MPTDALNQLTLYTVSRGDPGFIHQHQVDAWAASQDIDTAKPIRIFFALAGLYLLFEEDYTGRQIQAAHTRMANVHRGRWPRFTPPMTLSKITPDDVMAKQPGVERDKAIIEWCQAVWDTWQAEHANVRQETMKLLQQ